MNKNAVRKLQVGTGPNFLQGWINTDLIPTKNKLYMDASKKFPFEVATFDYIFSEHLLEHLSYDQGINFIRECRRVLKPEGMIRIATPDLNFLIALYNEEKNDAQRQYIDWAVKASAKPHPSDDPVRAVFIINNFVRSWGHKFIYDYNSLAYILAQEGFRDITKCNVGESADSNLRALETHGKLIGDRFNKLESLVLEATRGNIG
jgi:predicted SAM-dependent methyltransferase